MLVPGAYNGSASSGAISSAYFPPTIASVVVSGALATDAAGNAMPTDGGTALTVSGRDFGPAGTSIALSYSSNTSSLGLTYLASACVVSVPDAVATCASTPGVGAGLSFRLQAGANSRQVSAPFSGSLVRYALPTVATAAPALISTRGVDTLTLTGANFGPLGKGDLVVRYSSAPNWAAPSALVYTASSCAVTVAHRTLTCTTHFARRGNRVYHAFTPAASHSAVC